MCRARKQQEARCRVRDRGPRAIVRDGGAGRRRALAANHFRLATTNVVNDQRRVAAWTIEMRLDHLQRKRGRDGCIEGVAALLQHCHADRCGDPVRRGDDTESAVDFRACREWVRIDEAHAGETIMPPASCHVVEGLARARGRRHEFERYAVHAVAQSGGLRTVIEDVAEMAAATLA